jgi:hypothetical protein
MKLLRFLTLLTNLGFLMWLLYVALVEGLGQPSFDWLIFIGFFVFLVSNFYFIVSEKKGNDWLSLWFRRKSLEEKRKIEDLEKNN